MNSLNGDQLQFAEEAPAAGVPAVADVPAPWRVLIVDDDPEVHAVTRLALGTCRFEGRPVELLSAHSGTQARELLARIPDIALILLDVVMESDRAGLDLVRHIREEIGNHNVRIVLRTGQPGQAPPRDVVARYEIDDYRTKTELTFDRLYILVMSALRTYQLLQQLETRRRKLIQSNEDLERFAYVASHDLQTPLRGIISFAQLLRRKLGASMDAESSELLDFVVKGARDLHALIADLLDFSRVGRQEIPRASVDLNEVLRGALDKIRTVVETRGARVEAANLPRVEGNATELEQLLRNLVENGIKFQPTDAPLVIVTAEAVGGFWEIRVRDRGIGIEPAYLESVFEVFHRLHPQDRFPGTGIGLAICRKVAQRHGGSIRAESTPGEGTTMVVRLPARQAA